MGKDSQEARRKHIRAILDRTAAWRAERDAFIASPNEPKPAPEPITVKVKLPQKAPKNLPQCQPGYLSAKHKELIAQGAITRKELEQRYTPLAGIVRREIERVLDELGGDVSKTAIALRVHRTTVIRNIPLARRNQARKTPWRRNKPVARYR